MEWPSDVSAWTQLCRLPASCLEWGSILFYDMSLVWELNDSLTSCVIPGQMFLRLKLQQFNRHICPKAGVFFFFYWWLIHAATTEKGPRAVTNDTFWLLSYQPKYHTESRSHFQGQENSRRSECSLSCPLRCYEKRAPCVKYQQLIQPATGDRRFPAKQTNKLKVDAAWQKWESCCKSVLLTAVSK